MTVYGEEEEPDGIEVPPSNSQAHHRRNISREHSAKCVAIENQQAKTESFHPWTVRVGQWGGRLGETVENDNHNSNALSEPEVTSVALTTQEWIEKSERLPFSQHAPNSLLHSVQDILSGDNMRHAQENAHELLKDHPINTCLDPPREGVVTENIEQTWSVGPECDWLQAPIISRPSVGRELLDRATRSISSGNGENYPYRTDTWSSPFTVMYLNVGRRHLVGSLSEVVEIILRFRPDILFIGDMVTSRDKVGRLTKQLESCLHGEWFVTTNISALPGRPVGVGAIIHCSLAKHMTDCIIACPTVDGSVIDKQEWTEAVDGRMQCIKVTCPGSPFTWQFVGVYQHVAKRANRAARALVRSTIASVVEKAKKEDHRIVILGDFNAAPPGGRWGYSKWSAAVAEDRTMNDWVRGTNLTEVLQQSKPTPTWRPSEGPQEATLDRVFTTRESLPSLGLSVQWCSPLIFDHASLLVRIDHSQIGTGYAGACRPERDAYPASRCSVNLRQWRKHIPEWSQLVQEGLATMSAEPHDTPLDPYEALKRGELLALSVAQAIAPKYVRKPGDTRRAFGFAGNRLLFRELNLLRKARSIVYKVLAGDAATLHCPHRQLRWTLATRSLHLQVTRSKHAVPTPLDSAPHHYFTPEARRPLQAWLERLNSAIASRQAAVRESYEKARYYNMQNLRKLRK